MLRRSTITIASDKHKTKRIFEGEKINTVEKRKQKTMIQIQSQKKKKKR